MEFVIGDDDRGSRVRATGTILSNWSNGNIPAFAFGLDSLTDPAGVVHGNVSGLGGAGVAFNSPQPAKFHDHVGVGYHYLAALEKGGGAGVYFGADAANGTFGIECEIMG